MPDLPKAFGTRQDRYGEISARGSTGSGRRRRTVLAATVNLSFVVTQNFSLWACRFRRSRPALWAFQQSSMRGTDARMGDQDVAEALSRPREPVEPVIRFETPPGRQGQVDFGTFTLP